MIVVLPADLSAPELARLRARCEAKGWRCAESRGAEQTVLAIEGVTEPGDVAALVAPEIDADFIALSTAAEYARRRWRRRALTTLAAGLAALLAFAVLVPLVGYLEPPVGAGSDTFGPVARLGELPIDGAKRLLIDGRPVLLVRPGAEELRALSATCTFAGACLLEWDAPRRALVCPLHGIAYDLAGEVVHGPAIEPLAALRVERVEDRIYVGGLR